LVDWNQQQANQNHAYIMSQEKGIKWTWIPINKW
jgi:hypothetical protein